MALLDSGADPNVTDRAGNTPLHVAAQTGSLEVVKKLLSKGAKTDVQTPGAGPSQNQFRPVSGAQTPLLLAARNGHVEVMRTLIEAGADTKLTGEDGAPLLLTAAGSGRVAAAKYAFEFDKNVAAKDKNGRTAMHAVVGRRRRWSDPGSDDRNGAVSGGDRSSAGREGQPADERPFRPAMEFRWTSRSSEWPRLS